MGFWDAYERSRQATQGILARARVGGALAQGDYGGAAQEAYRLGMYGEGQAFEEQGRQSAQRARMAQYGQQFANGQGADAARSAYSQGDWEAGGAIQQAVAGMDAQQRAESQRKNEVFARDAFTLRSLPMERRLIDGPRLAAQHGVQVPEGFDWSDASLDGVINQSRSLDQLLKGDEAFTLSQGQTRFDARGNAVASLAPKPDYLVVPEGGQAVLVNGGQSSTVARVPGAQPASQPGGQGPGLSSYPQVQAAITAVAPGARFTSGERSRAEQDSLIASGATSARNSAHLPGGLGQDFVPNAPRSQWQGIADQLMATGQFRRVIVEGGGPGQGTGPHIHAEPIVGQAQGAAPAQAGGPPATIQGPPRRGGRQMTAQEAQAMGLDPRQAWWLDKDGKPEAIGGSARQQRDAQQRLRREFLKRQEVIDYTEIAANYRQIQQLARPGASASDDIALIFSYMKMLDPGSVVREGEFATAQNAASVPDQVRNAYNKAMRGNRLNDNQRQQFAGTAQRIYDQRRSRYDQVVSEYEGYAEDSGLDSSFLTAAPPPPQPQGDAGRGNRNWTAQQRQMIGHLNLSGPRGSDSNPYLIDPSRPEASFRAIPSGALFVTPDGKVKRKS